MTALPKTIDRLGRSDTRPAIIVFLGDSNTETTFHTEDHHNVVGLVQMGIFQRYGARRAQVINAGRCGGTADEALARLDDDVLRYQPDLVFIGFSMNDANRGLDGIPLFRESMTELIARIRTVGAAVVLRTSNPVVACNQPDWATHGLTPGEEWPDKHQGLYAEAIVALGQSLDCPVVDHYQAWSAVENVPHQGSNNPNRLWLRMSDAIHPNARGHRAFYNELAPLLDLPTVFSWER